MVTFLKGLSSRPDVGKIVVVTWRKACTSLRGLSQHCQMSMTMKGRGRTYLMNEQWRMHACGTRLRPHVLPNKDAISPFHRLITWFFFDHIHGGRACMLYGAQGLGLG